LHTKQILAFADAIAVAQENRRGPAKVAHLTEKHARLAEVAEREAEYTELMYRRCGAL